MKWQIKQQTKENQMREIRGMRCKAHHATVVGMAIAGFVLGSLSARATDTPLLSNPTGTLRTYSDGVDTINAAVGYQFTPTSNLTVVALGFYDAGQDGLTIAHSVQLWMWTGPTNGFSSGLLVGSVTIPAGTSATLIGDYRYEPIPSITLTNGVTYGLQASSTTDQWPERDGSFTLDLPVVMNQAWYNGGDPTLFQGGLQSVTETGSVYLAPNLLGFAVPEPSSVLLVGLGAEALWARRRRK